MNFKVFLAKGLAVCLPVCLTICLIVSSLLFATPSFAAIANHKVVIEVVSGEPNEWDKLMNNIENLQIALGKNLEVEVVVHGAGLSFLTKAHHPPVDRMLKAVASGVKFAACENSMKKKKIKKEQLVDLAITVDSGIAEVVRKQEESWSYIKN